MKANHDGLGILLMVVNILGGIVFIEIVVPSLSFLSSKSFDLQYQGFFKFWSPVQESLD